MGKLKDYAVTLDFNLSATSPQDALKQAVAALASTDPVEWSYQVIDTMGTVTYFNTGNPDDEESDD